jgi:CheY-like chemotaxis protein
VLRPSVGHSNELVIDLDRNARQVLVDAGQFQFALLNLVANAKDAMQDAGCVRINTRNITVDERLADKWRVAPGDYVAVAVSDTGRGMPPDVVDRAFEPGFTTKEVGKGSGLGLSSVYGFVAQSHGHAEISSRQGHGTTVTLYLPATAIQVLPGGLEQSEDRLPAGRGTVLVVDDDPAVMAIASELLEQRGFRILSAPNGKIALKTLGGAAGVDVLFTDFAMPGMDGLELADHARKMRPGLQVLLTSGYAPELIEMRGIEFIPKPYGIEELTARIADMASRHSG